MEYQPPIWVGRQMEPGIWIAVWVLLPDTVPELDDDSELLRNLLYEVDCKFFVVPTVTAVRMAIYCALSDASPSSTSTRYYGPGLGFGDWLTMGDRR